ncbi:Eukaryotic translation initiation factor 3 subunit D [Hondaea fermentalgiana]|uniref:Eukaryotic translation initiation factor 3 subunit D n=1 Tax=Hondaea fermentalgiana TaxID=2315210 RepID=A0A2R5GM21_9STRA|nr:Eukaryotic translation initiation factor 3 subunit D [Hondaea fermentalgiana]|eukprot:GBG31930.1 Eukaryotic translation initiation factor 3 subunit D [Hondaea fermentalgiana]
MASFYLPEVHVNIEGWGPTTLPEKFVRLPFATFGKNDKLGRAADFSASKFGRGRFRDREREAAEREAAAQAEANGETFKMVEDPDKKAKTIRSMRGRSFRGRWQSNRRWHAKRNEQEPEKLLQGKKAKYLVQHARRGKQWRGRGGRPRQRWNQRNLPTVEPSVKVGPDWKILEQFELPALTKLQMAPPKAEDLKTCGHLYRFDDKLDRVSTRLPQKVKRFNNVQFNATTTIDDPVMQEYAQEYARKGSGERVLFATDELLAHLMAAPRSVKPWDVYFTRMENGLMFLDKREDSGLEMLTVNETMAQRQPQENEKLTIAAYDQPEKLSIEASAINQSFSQQAVDKEGKKKTFPAPNPFWDPEEEEEGTEPASFAYKYRKWKLSDDLSLVARTELHGYMRKNLPGKKGNHYLTLFAINEANPKISGAAPWRSKIDSSRGAVIATELKNNACKMGKWTAQSLIAGADYMKIGFVSRASVKDPFNHNILATQSYKPKDFAAQINMQETNMWGIIKSLADIIYKHPAGKYVLLKDPNKPIIQIYSVPMSYADQDSDEDEDDEDYDDEDDEEYEQ